MKKTRLFAALLAVTLVVTAFCACLSVSAAKGDNLAKGKTYTGAAVSTHDAVKGYNANLTDGKASDKLTYDGEWFAFYYSKDATGEGNNNAPNGIGTFVIDLGATYPVGSVKINTFLGNISSIQAPKSIKVEYSTDNENFSVLAEKTFDVAPEKDVTIENLTFEGEKSVNAQYIRVTVTKQDNGSVYMFLNEVEVIEGDPVSGGTGDTGDTGDDKGDTGDDKGDTDTNSPSTTTPSTSTPSTSTPSTSTGPAAGDAGLIGFAVLAVAAISGLAVAVKVRK